jgi:serine/threonine-protein kinase
MSTSYKPGTRISEYLLEERIGVGSFGEVWRARHHVWDNEHVAIKLPTEPEYVRYLQREGVVVHGLRHPNVVRVLGLDPYGEMPYLVMELVKGPSLAAMLKQAPGGLPIDVAVTILRGILSGISSAHAAGVLHRDLKPGNVLLHLGGKPLAQVAIDDVKLVDFGLGVKNVDSLRSIVQSASIDRDSKLVGTLAYMAPELRDGGGVADARSDLYAVGIILFEMLTGERPAGAELPGTLRPDVFPALDEVYKRLYARHDRRFASAQAVLDELDQRLRANTRPGNVPPVPAPAYPALPDRALRVPGVGQLRRPACSACGHVSSDEDQFCTHCGNQLVRQVRRCGACGAFPGPRDVFCIFCGASLPQTVER